MNSYTWDIRGFKLEHRDQHEDVVNTVLFRITVTDPTGVYTHKFDSEAYLSSAQLDNFIPFAQLDLATVVAWIKSCFTVEDYAKTLAGLDLALAQHISDQVNNARIVKDLPWGGQAVDLPWGTSPNPEDYAASAAENPL